MKNHWDSLQLVQLLERVSWLRIKEDLPSVQIHFDYVPSVRPLTLSLSAVFRKAGKESWGTFTSPAYMNSKINCKWLNGTSFKMIIGCLHGFVYELKFSKLTTICRWCKCKCIGIYLEKWLEIWTTCRKNHFVCLDGLSITCQCEISKVPLLSKIFEAHDYIGLEIMPPQTELLLTAAARHCNLQLSR